MIGSHFDICHVDEGALDWAIKKWKVKRFLDIGCGIGGMVDLAAKKGLDAWGIDGDERQKKDRIIIHDFREDKLDAMYAFDLGWSVEFLEHVEEEYVFQIMPTFRMCKRVIVTHALPPNSPPGHVNCQEAPYWVRVFNLWGFYHDLEASREVREVSTMAREFMRNTGKVFVKR